MVRRTRPAPSRGARRSRSSTRTTSRGGTCGAIACPPRRARRRVVSGCRRTSRRPSCCIERRKPRLQRSFQETAAASFGPVPFSGPRSAREMARVPGPLHRSSSARSTTTSGTCCARSHSRPEVAANTVIVFTSDHGEYGASHGLRGKGASAYEEAIRVPLIVKDPRGKLTARARPAAHPADLERRRRAAAADDRQRLVATGAANSTTRTSPTGSTSRASSRTPTPPGREFVLHATDEIVTEFAIEPYAADAPLHVVAIRTPEAKYATYSNWPDEGIAPLAAGPRSRALRLRTQSGRLEIDNSAGEAPLEDALRASYERAFSDELREPLPERLRRGARARLRRLLLDRAARRHGRGRAAQTARRTRSRRSSRTDRRPRSAGRAARRSEACAARPTTPMTAPRASSACTAT